MKRIRPIVVVAAAVITACAEASSTGSGVGAGPGNGASSAIVAMCGGVTFSTLPPDPSGFRPFDRWAEVDLSEIGTEREFFEEYDWFVADETSTTLRLFGSTESDKASSLYASAGFRWEDGTWKPGGWGDCRIELSAPGWGNARFVLDPDNPPDPSASTVTLLATEVNCAGGQRPNGREVRAVVLDDAPGSVSIVVLVEPAEGAVTCQGNPAFRYEVDLGSPLGDRHVLDASVYPPVDVSIAGG